jgi:hypothetical protein
MKPAKLAQKVGGGYRFYGLACPAMKKPIQTTDYRCIGITLFTLKLKNLP